MVNTSLLTVMRKLLKYLYRNTYLGYLLIHPAIRLRYLFRIYLIPEKLFIKQEFKQTFGYELNLDNPKTLNEKIQWLKLNDRTPLHTLCADKYAVREYVKKKIGEEYLIPLLYHTQNPTDIVPKNMPDFPFIIKTNHDSLAGGNFIVRDKSKVNWKSVQKALAKLLRRNFYYVSKEWQYKNIEPRIIVEKLLLDRDGHIPKDYKFECINNKVAMIHVDQNKEIKHQRKNYNINWELLPVLWPTFIENGKSVNRPVKLNEMIELAETLSKPFCFARIDFYYFNNKVYFGEITFHPTSGLGVFKPHEWDRKFGDMLRLPW